EAELREAVRQEVGEVAFITEQCGPAETLSDVAPHLSRGVVRLRAVDVFADDLTRPFAIKPAIGENAAQRQRRTVWPDLAEAIDQPLRPLLGLRGAEAELACPFAEARRREEIHHLVLARGGDSLSQEAARQLFLNDVERPTPLLLAAAEERVD